jgi:hypothetical protein
MSVIQYPDECNKVSINLLNMGFPTNMYKRHMNGCLTIPNDPAVRYKLLLNGTRIIFYRIANTKKFMIGSCVIPADAVKDLMGY